MKVCKVICFVLLALSGFSAAAEPTPESPFKFGGFADLRHTNLKSVGNPLILSGHEESGFGIEDGAIFVNYDKENLSLVLDLAFRRSKVGDTDADAPTKNESNDNNLAIGVEKSQLYLKYKINPIWSVDFGQFDTIFGVEANDSKDRIFGKGGLIYEHSLPTTHTGVMAEVTHGSWYFKPFAANPNNKGSDGSHDKGDDRTEYGGTVGFGNDMVHAQAGYMSRSVTKAVGTGSGNRTLMDAIVGGNWNKFSLDFEYSRVQDPSKNTLTPSVNTDSEDPSQSYFGLLSYKPDDVWTFGIRAETEYNDPYAKGIKKSRDVGATVHYKVNPQLELRSEWIRYDSTGNTELDAKGYGAWHDTLFDVAAVVVF